MGEKYVQPMAGIYLQSGIVPGAVNGPGDLGYFGLDSKSDGWKRLDEHYRYLKAGKHHNQFIQKFYDERGIGQFYRNIVVECDEYYLNTVEKAYIHYGNTNRKFNAEGWNKSGGGEGAKKYEIPFSFVHEDTTLHQGTNLLVFLKATGQKDIDPGGFIQLHDGRLKEYNGFKLL